MPDTSPSEIEALLRAVRGRSLLVVGDLCLDEYRYGAVTAIAKEAPVACLDEAERLIAPGQAANVAANAAVLGGEVRVVAVLGADGEGRRLNALLGELGVDTGGVLELAERPTTAKLKLVATAPDEQHVFHSYRERRGPLADDVIEWLRGLIVEAGADCAAVVVSDYGNGVVDDRLLETVRSINKPWLADTRDDLGRFAGAACLKPNRREVELWWRCGSGGTASLADKAAGCRRELGLDWLCVTRGRLGMDLYHADGRLRREALCAPRRVVDATGAGDTVSAALGLALAAGLNPTGAVELASCAAADVVARPGTSLPRLEKGGPE